jgi:predicted amidohydrolase YtcJ
VIRLFNASRWPGLFVLGLSVTSVFADTLYSSGTVYTLDSSNTVNSSVCVRGDRIVAVESCQVESNVDLAGATVIPGFIESHGHLMSLGFSKLRLDLTTVKNLDELVGSVARAVDSAEPGEWILGRGWHQSKWTPAPIEMIEGFQTNRTLNEVSSENPVFLVHASGHAAFVNDKALALAGIEDATRFSGDGEIIRDAQGRATGVLNERAQRLVSKIIPEPSASQRQQALMLALQNLAEQGVTSFQDAGTGQQTIDLYKQFLAEGRLTSRIYVMLSGGDDELLSKWMDRGPEIGLGDNRLTIRAIKLVADGALGSRGAWLLAPYSDRIGHVGLPTMPVEDMADISHLGYQNGFQVGIHAIGDRANREVLDVFDELFDGRDRGVRFRIEHAQHIDPIDIPRFGQLGVIASMQGIHLSSDRPWAIKRLGQQRIEQGAYVWRALIDSGAVLINGTDAPVEPVNAIASFYALVSRKTLAGTPDAGYEPGQRLTRFEALRSYTSDAAYGAFEEGFKGSLEPGKVADFVVLDRDILKIAEQQILTTTVLKTIVGGQLIYEK